MEKADDSINDYAQFDYDFLDIPKFEKSRNRMLCGGAQEAATVPNSWPVCVLALPTLPTAVIIW